jgi:hypothetical protein
LKWNPDRWYCRQSGGPTLIMLFMADLECQPEQEGQEDEQRQWGQETLSGSG